MVQVPFGFVSEVSVYVRSGDGQRSSHVIDTVLATGEEIGELIITEDTRLLLLNGEELGILGGWGAFGSMGWSVRWCVEVCLYFRR